MTDWLDPTVVIGASQAIIALALVYFTIKLARSTEAYSNQVTRQTTIMERNIKVAEEATKITEKCAERERLLRKYDRLTNEMTDFIAPLYSRIGDMQVFNLYIPSQKVAERRGQIDDLNLETYSFWEKIRQTEYLNQSKDVERILNNYFAAIDAYQSIRTKTPQSESQRKETNTLQEVFERNRASLFDTLSKRYSQVQKELGELEIELGIQEA
jgi:hypothetical protein